MSIQVYNTLTKRKEQFEPVDPPNVGIYLCGPTVYKPSHIGHAVGPIIFDAVSRYLRHRGYDVRLVVNITDVDDKLIAEAEKQDRDMLEIAREVEDDYRRGMDALGVRSITDWPRATEHIEAIIDLVRRLVEAGAAYEADGDVYFDHLADEDYGKLSGRRTAEAMHGSRDLSGQNKRHPADFAIWKASKPGEPAWDSPWGPGRPGWHIECSAMSMEMLGETFDIHGGGMDLIFPHHENEIAQSETATGTCFAKYWMHNGLTRVVTKAGGGRTEKMSKSLGNIRTIRDLLDEHDGETIRAFVLSTHYRRPLDFSDEQLAASRKALENFYRVFDFVKFFADQDVYADGPDVEAIDPDSLDGEDRRLIEKVAAARERFFAGMDNDFNTADAMAALHEMANAVTHLRGELGAQTEPPLQRRNAVAVAGRTIVKLGRILGLFENPPAAGEPADDERIDQLIAERTEARKNRNFARADEIRDELAEMGITLEDTPGGTLWHRT